MSEVFEFEPKDFQIVEDLEYDETIQRPETIRFYTLNEQVTDAYEKLVPKGRTTKFQMDVLKNEVDRLKDLYKSFIVATADDYRLREPVYGKNFDWIFPVYATNGVKPYSYAKSYNPLFDDAHTKTPNFYRSLLLGLPRPYTTETEGTPYPLSKPTHFLNSAGEDPLRALPVFSFTRTQRHEDGRFDITPTSLANTDDLVSFVGYYGKKRPVDVPNPLPDHPFLKSADAVMVESTAPLSEIVPSLDAVMTHAVPVTKDPYVEGLKYLKVYDIKLSDIPWDSWKSRFPPADSSDIALETLELTFPKATGDKPSDKLLEYYAPYYPGLSARYWLTNQLDGGELVIQMLRSQVGKNGTTEMRPSADSEHAFPETTLAECELGGLDFQTFQMRGVLRRTWGSKITYQCIPLELLRQERKQEGFKSRVQWKEGTSNEILETYVRALRRSVMPRELPKPNRKERITPAREVSQQRKDVVAILEDPQRFPDDKLRDITDLIREAIFDQKVYTDKDGGFVVCQHTLAILGGELAADRRLFYDTWTAKVDGFRVCRSCGEQINADVLENQEDFNDSGRVEKHAEALGVQEFHGKSSADNVGSLMALKNVFDFSKPSDEVFFMLISLLHVLPDSEQLLPILNVGRRFAVALKDFGGLAGIVQAILLMQSHRPKLVPRRSFGSKPLTLSGFPRDTDDSEGYTIVDSMILVLTKTMEAFPTSFKGTSASIMRLVLNNPKKVRTLVVSSLKSLLKQSADTLATLKKGSVVGEVVEEPKPNTMIPGDLPMPSDKEFGTIIHPPTCPSYRTYWTTSHAPQLRQVEVPLRPGINQFTRPDSNRKLMVVANSDRVVPEAVNIKDKDVLRRLKSATAKAAATDNWRTNIMIANRLSVLFAIPNPTASLDPQQKNDELRDITKGYIYELVAEISKDPVKLTKYQTALIKDATLVLLLADVKEAKAVSNTLRAKERFKITNDFRNMKDDERAVIKELTDRGLWRTLITNEDRQDFAKEQAEAEAAERARAENAERDVGVGRPIDYEEQGEVPEGQGREARVEEGNYGDYAAVPGNEGRDYVDADMFDDDDRGI